MAATVTQVRTQISDRPKFYPPFSSAPEIIGYGDGVTTQFEATFENSHDIGATVTTGPLCRWTSTKAFLFVELTPAAASNPAPSSHQRRGPTRSAVPAAPFAACPAAGCAGAGAGAGPGALAGCAGSLCVPAYPAALRV